MLAANVQTIPPVMVPGLNAPFQFPCHTAACYWLYKTAFGKDPYGDVILSETFSNTTGVMTALAKLGKKLSSSATPIPPGTVLILTDTLMVAQHTCIVRMDGKLGGYNQLGWFPLGLNHDFSAENQSSIRWRNGKNHKIFLKVSGMVKGHLVGVSEDVAVNFMKHAYGSAFGAKGERL